MTPLPPPWSQCVDTLGELLKSIEAAHAASLASVSSGNADDFATCCARLNQQLAKEQSGLARALSSGQPPAEVLEMLQKVQNALSNLYAGTARLQAQANRAAAVLFPQDQVRAYSKLGNTGYGNQPKAGTGYIKA